MSTTNEETAAEACLAALTAWFQDLGEPNIFLADEDPARVVEFLFGQLVATITNISEMMEVDPAEYVKMIAYSVACDINDLEAPW